MCFFSLFAAIATLMLPLLFSNDGSYSINGESVTRDVFFAKEGFFLFSMPFVVVYVAIVAYAIYDERAWSRPLLLAYFPVCGIIGGLSFFFMMPVMSGPQFALQLRPLLVVQVLEFLFFAALSWWYLYRKRNVVAYYRSIANAPRR